MIIEMHMLAMIQSMIVSILATNVVHKLCFLTSRVFICYHLIILFTLNNCNLYGQLFSFGVFAFSFGKVF